jgi:pimeloyl-ACP methyl ester carboxylesterase
MVRGPAQRTLGAVWVVAGNPSPRFQNVSALYQNLHSAGNWTYGVGVTNAMRPSEGPPAGALMYELRSIGEFAAYLAMAPMLASTFCGPRRGDGHPVMVLPPFVSDDPITAPMRSFLQTIGYRVEGWQLGPNLGCTDKIIEGVPRRLLEMAERYGQPVSMVGWSAGGMWAREAARQHPEAVRQVITLGSPFRMRPGDRTNASVFVEMLGDIQVPWPDSMMKAEHERAPICVPRTSVYSRTDGVASFSMCLDEEGPTSENVEIFGSHTGLGHNPAVLAVVGDRLAQPVGQWRPFVAPRHMSHYFPRPANWARAS